MIITDRCVSPGYSKLSWYLGLPNKRPWTFDNSTNGDSESVVFTSGQKMALRAFYFIRALTYYYISRSQRHLLAALSAIFWPLSKTTDSDSLYNDSIQSKIIPVLKLPHFFSRRVGHEKERQSQNWIFFD